MWCLMVCTDDGDDNDVDGDDNDDDGDDIGAVE